MNLPSRPSEPSTDVQPVAPRRLGRVTGFDGLRGVMLLVVIVCHMSLLIPGHGLLLLPEGTRSAPRSCCSAASPLPSVRTLFGRHSPPSE